MATHDNDVLDNVVITEKDIAKKLHNLDPVKAPGPDCILPSELKELAPDLSKAIAMIFNKSL